jgi:hypothetical protein
MMLFCPTFGALAPSEREGCQHQGGRRGPRPSCPGDRTVRPVRVS